jgi:hypothetical protein
MTQKKRPPLTPTGSRPIWRLLLFSLALIAAPRAYADPPGLMSWGLPQLMAGMREVRSATARFSERKFDRLLKQPLLSSGTLIYVAPDQLQKETLAPVPSRLTVKGDHLTVVQPDGKTRVLLLSEYPALGALIESARATLAGDARLRAILTSIRIQGAGNAIRGIETWEHDGDRTEMTIVPESR